MEKRSENFEKKERELDRELQEIEKQKEEVKQLHSEEMVQLQKIASLTKEEAKARLLSEMDKELTAEKAKIIREKVNAQVSINGDKKGSIEFKFNSEEELENILEQLNLV